MIAPLFALKRRARRRRMSYNLPPPTKPKVLQDLHLDLIPAKSASPSTPSTESTTVISSVMAFLGEITEDEMMVDKKSVTDDNEVGLLFKGEENGEEEAEAEVEEEEESILLPKAPFKDRVNPFLTPKNEKFLEIENYFFSLLGTPELTIDDILKGTFDPHEITLITPQSDSRDLRKLQRRNARRYYENLETRFKGHPETLAFKLACLYFGFPVAPLRTGTMSPLGPGFLEESEDEKKKAKPAADPLKFLEEYEKKIRSIYGDNTLSLRGGGASDYEDTGESEYSASQGGFKQNNKSKRPLAGWSSEAIREITPEGYEMDITWNTGSQYEMTTDANTSAPTGKIPIYGWQGVMKTSLNHADFVTQVDRLISNWGRVDQTICVEIWGVSPVKLQESVTGMIYHSGAAIPPNNAVWDVVQKYFKTPGGADKYACFVRRAGDDSTADRNLSGSYQPLSTDRYVIRIENENDGGVAYMRVPRGLHGEHKPHQFSMEYMLAMQVLLLPEAPHAMTSFRNSPFGDSYQYLDPPSGLWKQVIGAQGQWGLPPTISFRLKHLDDQVVPVVIPGVFTSARLPELRRNDFQLKTSPNNGNGLSKIHEILGLTIKNVDLNCDGLEIWWPGPSFRYITEQPRRVRYPGNTSKTESQQDWHELLTAGGLPNGPFSVVVRPVYTAYRLQKPGGNERISLQINQSSLEVFKAFVQDRFYKGYNPAEHSQVIILGPASRESYQLELTIQQDTTEEEWQWIRRNIIEPDLVVSVEEISNEWRIPENSLWGPRYAAKINSDMKADTMEQSTPKIQRGNLSGTRIYESRAVFGLQASSTRPAGALRGGGQEKVASSAPNENPEALNLLFKNSKNTMNEAASVRALRERSFANVNSIFTNPLKPVLPLYGPPLESIIRTGPSMPGVSIGMMTPTEMHRLQYEVQALRLQILDRTRQCPYADCDRLFEYRDAAGLDRHVREDHSVLRCFLCDKSQHLLPYYNADQIKRHFVAEHVDDILEAYGVGGVDTIMEEEEEEEEDIQTRELGGRRRRRQQQQKQKSQRRVQQMKENSGIAPGTAPDGSLGTGNTSRVPNPPQSNRPGANRREKATGQPSSNTPGASVSQATPGNNKQGRPWIDSVFEEYEIRGGKLPTGEEGVGIRMDIFRAAKKYPGVTQQNPEAIKKFLDEYEAQLGKPGPLPEAAGGQSTEMGVADSGDDSTGGEEGEGEGEEGGAGGGGGGGRSAGRSERRKRKRPRPIDIDTPYRKDQDNSGEEDYEYSEKSAVSDPLSPLLTSSAAVVQPPRPSQPPKKKQKQQQQQQQQKQSSDGNGGGGSGSGSARPSASVRAAVSTPVTVTRTGRSVKASRAAREAADSGDLGSLAQGEGEAEAGPGKE